MKIRKKEMRKTLEEYREDYEKSLLAGDITYLDIIKQKLITRFGYTEGNEIVNMFESDLRKKYLDTNVRIDDERDKLGVRDRVSENIFNSMISKVNKIIK
jgi:hypothetical protein